MMSSRTIADDLDHGIFNREYIEAVVIGSAISWNECWEKARRVLTKRVFSSAKRRFVWQLLSDMKREGKAVDEVSMFEYACERYPGMKNPCDLGAFIAEMGLVVNYGRYDYFLSELLRLYTKERMNVNGKP